MTSIVKLILIWAHHHPIGMLGPKNQGIWTLLYDETKHVCNGTNHPIGGVPYLVTLIVQGQWLYN